MATPTNPTIKAIMQSIKTSTISWAEVNESEDEQGSKDGGYVEHSDYHDGSWADAPAN